MFGADGMALGYASPILLFFAYLFIDKVAAVLAKLFAPFTAIPWPWLGIFLGQTGDGSRFHFPVGLVACWAIAAITVAGVDLALAFGERGAEFKWSF